MIGDGWTLCPQCAMPRPPRKRSDLDPAGCILAAIVGAAGMAWVMFALASLGGR